MGVEQVIMALNVKGMSGLKGFILLSFYLKMEKLCAYTDTSQVVVDIFFHYMSIFKWMRMERSQWLIAFDLE